MVWSEFAEREYETGFNRQIALLHDVVWTPGQCQEKWLGFDAAFLSAKSFIFDLLNPWSMFAMPDGIIPNPTDWEQFVEDAQKYLPPVKFNLFVQHKRPEYVCGPRGGERNHWKKSYFRFLLDAEQQVRLEALEAIVGPDAVVTYACAAFHTRKQLWHHMSAKTIIPNSNFVRPSKLSNHGRYTFVKAGSQGKAYSEPEDIEDTPLDERINQASSEDDRDLAGLIHSAGKAVKSAVAESDADKSLFEEVVRNAIPEGVEEGSLLFAYIAVQAFCFINATSWSIVGNRRKE